MSDDKMSMSGLTEEEAKEFHKFFMQGFLGFSAVAVVAHILVWSWRPWIPGPEGYASLEGATELALASLPFLS